MQLTRLYQDGDEWRSTHSFGRNDLLTVAKVADLAHSKVCELEASERDREETPGGDLGAQSAERPVSGGSRIHGMKRAATVAVT